MTDDEPASLQDVMDFPINAAEVDQRWLVLFSDDFDDWARDPQGNLGLLVDQQQAGEVLSLCAEAVAAMSPREATGDDVLRDMRDALDAEIEEEER